MKRNDGPAVESINCAECGRVVVVKATGRPPIYCSVACRMRAYRARKREEAA